jgi:hypothetical protein
MRSVNVYAVFPCAQRVGDIPERHNLHWHTETNMRDRNPILALEDGEAVETPPDALDPE